MDAAVSLSAVLQALTVAAIVWFGGKVQKLAETVAEHGEKHRGHDDKHRRHDERLSIIENKI